MDRNDKQEMKKLVGIWLVLFVGMIVACILCTATNVSFAMKMFDTLGLSVLPNGLMNMDAHNLPVLTHWWGGITFAVGAIWFFAFCAFTPMLILIGIGTGMGMNKWGTDKVAEPEALGGKG